MNLRKKTKGEKKRNVLNRSFLGISVRGIGAVEFYQKAFDAKLVSEHKNDDGTYMHAELDVYGQVIAIQEIWPRDMDLITGTIMQFNLHFASGKQAIVEKAYEVLKEDAQINFPLGECFFSPLMFGLIDKYGVNWCVFVDY
ncbi:MAG: VOC family protein [Oscillospiraceae bacterium]|nr:VOC family protein [Oscillospiraceae bacterium]